MPCRSFSARFFRILFLFFLALSVFGAGGPAVRANWLFSYAPNQVTLDSGKRNNVFLVGDPVKFSLTIFNYGTYTLQGTVRYEVRDYWGNVVASGAVPAPAPNQPAFLSLPTVTQPGWYKLYLHQMTGAAPWGDSVGGTMFVIFRPNANFPVEPSETLPGNSGGSDGGDEVARGVLGMGPQRHPVNDVSQPAAAIAQIDPAVAQDKVYYTPFDPQRGRPLLIAFPNGIYSSDAVQQGKNLAGLQTLVAHYHNDIKYWEPRNEPNYAYSGADYVNKELKPFYQTIKSIDPSCKVLGPAVVTIGPYGLSWIEDFLKAGGGNYIDAFSFHAYNNVNGDLTLARQSLNALNALLTKYGIGNIEKWQTEQGYFAATYGAYQPRLQGRWTMLQMMVYEQYGIPKEHNHLWYDKSHGFWDVPAFWENEDGLYSYGSFDPAAPLMRVWSEELYGTNFASAFDLGPLGNKLYVGSLFSGPGKSVAAFQSAGRTDGSVTLNVSGGSSIHVVSAFGVASDLPVTAGQATLPVPELPVYVELAAGQTVQPVPVDYGTDLALTPGTVATSSGNGLSPLNASYPNSIGKIINGTLENWYWSQGNGDHPWMGNDASFPAWVQITLPQPMIISHAVVYAGVPWQSDGSLLDYELQYDQNGQWVTLSHPQEPTNVVDFFTPTVFCTADSFYSDRDVFVHDFAPVTTQKIRLLVHDVTWGGGAASDIVTAGGQTGPHQITLREIELYGPSGQIVPPPPPPPVTGTVRFYPRSGCANRMPGGKFQGSTDGVTYTDLYTIPSTPPDSQWTTAPLSADPKPFRYLRYLSPNGSYGNVSEIEYYSGTGTGAVKLTGTAFGSAGSYAGSGNTFAKAFDGITSTYFDGPGPNGNFTGIDQGGAGATVSSVNVTPATATIIGGQTQPFSATVSGAGSPAQTVTWTASAGSVSGAGVFTAPAATAIAQSITVTATSTVDGTKSGTATVTVPAIPVTVSGVSVTPATATVIGGQTLPFSATVSGAGGPAQTVTWTASAGSVSGAGVFTAPAATAIAQSITVTATSTVDGTKSGTATVTVPAIPVTVSGVSVTPATATVIGGQTLPFSATVSGAGSPAQTVTWTASAGSVSGAGVFTAPAATAIAQSITVTATSTVDGTKSGAATVTVPAAVVASSAGSVRFYPRSGCANRMPGGKFQGSTDGVTYTDLYTIPSTPPDSQWTTAALSADPKPFRYLRYLSPNGGWGNVSEIEFYSGMGTGAVKLTGTAFGSAGSYAGSGNTFAKAFDGITSTYFDGPGPNGNFTGIDQGGAGATVSSVNVTPATATIIGGQTQPFSATVSGAGSPAQTVTWTASAGSVSGAGVFTAPAATAIAQSITVTATSTVDGTKSGAATVTVPAANIAAGALKIGFLGDSITYGVGDSGGPGCYDRALTCLTQNGYQVTGVNYGNSGASVTSFYQQTLGPLQAFEKAGVTVVSVMLATNDASIGIHTSSQDYHDKLLWIVNSFLAPGTGIQKVILNYSPYIQSSGMVGAWDSTADTRLLTYQPQIDALCNGTTILAGDKLAYTFFQQHPEQGDGVHPNPQGHQDLGSLWAIAITNALGGTNTLPYPTGTVTTAP